MPFNINGFTSEISKNGFARSDFFEVFFTGFPNKVVAAIKESTTPPLDMKNEAESLALRAESVTIPQRAITPIEYKDYGAPYKIGATANYIEIDVTFILSKNMRERNIFLAWQDVITGNHRLQSTVARGSSFDIGYFDDYKCDGIQINHYKGDNAKEEIPSQPAYVTQLRDAYPLNVGPVSRSWASPEVLKQQVTFTYRYFAEKPSGLVETRTEPERVGKRSLFAGLGT
jgi:hypothetical protein